MAGVVLVATPVDLAQPGIITGVRVIRATKAHRYVAMATCLDSDAP